MAPTISIGGAVVSPRVSIVVYRHPQLSNYDVLTAIFGVAPECVVEYVGLTDAAEKS